MLLVAIPFVHNEKFDFSAKINDQKISNYFITVFTIIGTASAVYFSAKQFDISKRQMLLNIKPDVVPQDLDFRAGQAINFHDELKREIFDVRELIEPTLRLVNNGLGTAKTC